MQVAAQLHRAPATRRLGAGLGEAGTMEAGLFCWCALDRRGRGEAVRSCGSVADDEGYDGRRGLVARCSVRSRRVRWFGSELSTLGLRSRPNGEAEEALMAIGWMDLEGCTGWVAA